MLPDPDGVGHVVQAIVVGLAFSELVSSQYSKNYSLWTEGVLTIILEKSFPLASSLIWVVLDWQNKASTTIVSCSCIQLCQLDEFLVQVVVIKTPAMLCCKR